VTSQNNIFFKNQANQAGLRRIYPDSSGFSPFLREASVKQACPAKLDTDSADSFKTDFCILLGDFFGENFSRCRRDEGENKGTAREYTRPTRAGYMSANRQAFAFLIPGSGQVTPSGRNERSHSKTLRWWGECTHEPFPFAFCRLNFAGFVHFLAVTTRHVSA
jgi:hypothetical protein